jgi:quercetin dioxygenase-like cupin family protein
VFDFVAFGMDKQPVADSEHLQEWLEEGQMKNTAVWVLSLSLAGGTLVAQDGTVKSLLSKDLAGVPGKELLMITVEYPPGGSDTVHRHHAQTLVYVLEGSIVMQVRGEAPVTLVPGQTFYEGPDDVHIVSRNASHTAPAKFLVFFVKAKSAPILVPAK